MSINTTIALAYAAQDQVFAERIEKDLKGVASFRHFSADQQNDGASLANQLQDFSGHILLLISDNFLRSPNAMHYGNRMLSNRGGRNTTQAILIDVERYDAQIEETVIVPAKVNRQADIMNYINHWQERYLDLRRQKKALSEEIGPSFDDYLSKIREVSGQVNDFLHYLKDSMPLHLLEFKADRYRQFFIFMDAEDQWTNFQLTNVEATTAPPPPTDVPAATVEDLPLAVTAAEEAAEANHLATSLEQEKEAVTEEATPQPAENKEESIDNLIQRAWDLTDSGEWQTALDLLKSGAEAYPGQPDLIYHQALLLSTEADDIASAETILDHQLEEYPDHQDSLFLRGELYYSASDFEQARGHWENLADQNADYPDLAQELGLLLAKEFPKDRILALPHLEKAIKADSEVAEVYLHHGLLVAEELNKPEKAQSSFAKAVAMDPTLEGDIPTPPEPPAPEPDEAPVEAPTKTKTDGTLSQEIPAPATPKSPESITEETTTQAIEIDPTMLNSTSADALTALKENIAQLEALMQEKEAAAEAAQQAAVQAKQEARIGHGKTVLISGATSGIGKATAYVLAEAGYRLIITGRRGDRLEAVAAELREHEVDVLTLTFDVRDNAAVESAISDLGKKWSSIDILINNAGKAKGLAPIHKGDLDHWNEMIDVNLKGLLYLTRAVTPKMARRKKGFVLNVCSTAGKEVYPNGNVYCATKHAVDALTRAMRLDLVKYGIKVGQISPAHVEETEFAEVRFDGDKKKAAKVYEDFQPLTSKDVADSIAFMLGQPDHVNVLDMVIQGKQQASSSVIERSGR